MMSASFAGLRELPALDTEHKDLIHDISFNHNGQMLATCSSDQTIKIWRNDASRSCHEDTSWVQMQTIGRFQDGERCHSHKAAITMVTWASPVFGSVLASCSTDKVVNIFVEKESVANPRDTKHRMNKKLGFKFERVSTHHADAVSIAFAPPHLGLQLAIVCKEGKIDFYTANLRRVADLRQWQSSKLDLTKSLCPSQLTSLSPELLSSVSAPRFQSKDTVTASVSNPHSDPTAPSMIRSRSGGRTLKPLCMAWNASKWELPAFAIGADRNRVFVFKYFDSASISNVVNAESAKFQKHASLERAQTVNAVEDKKKGIDWHCVSTLTIPTPKSAPYFDVRGISWSSHLARKYHLIAIGCSDGFVRILKVMRHRRVLRKDRVPEDPLKLEWSVVFQSNIHCDAVWKVQWNVTGNVLLSAGDDARIYLWKRNRMGGDGHYVPNCISMGDPEERTRRKEEDEERCGAGGDARDRMAMAMVSHCSDKQSV